MTGRGPGMDRRTIEAQRLSERDWRVLDALAQHRFLTTQHLEAFCFHDHASVASRARTARRVLSRLEADRLLTRPARRIGGLQAGSHASVWMLTTAGLRLLNVRDGRGAVGRVREPGEGFIRHTLAVADLRLALQGAAEHGDFDLLEVAAEPACWRSFLGDAGERQALKPDFFAVTARPDSDFEDHWLFEVDRGTESLPTLIRQCRQYQAYYRSGSEQTARGLFPSVVWLVPDERRTERLRQAIEGARELTSVLFQVVIAEQVLPLLIGRTADQGGRP